jgi:hypothetical protein
MELLSAPTVEQIKERLDLKVFSGEENLRTRVYDAIVAAMEPYNMIGHLRDGALVITSGDRVDNMLVAVSSYLLQQGGRSRTKLIKYFLASLTIPEKDLWVNLSPYEKDRIIPQSFGLTEMGRDLLSRRLHAQTDHREFNLSGRMK